MRFKPCFQVEIVKPDRVFLLDQFGFRYWLKGTHYVRLAPHLIKGKGIPDKLLKDPIFACAILKLEQKGWIEKSEDFLPKPLAALSHLLEVSPQEAKKKLEETSITFHSIGKTTSAQFQKIAQQMRMQISSEGKLNVVVTDSYQRTELLSLCETWEKTNSPWMLVKPVGAQVWIGPLFVPRKTACYHCLLNALRRNEIEEAYIEQKTGKSPPFFLDQSTVPSTKSLAYNLASESLFKWILKGESELLDKIISINSCSIPSASHRVTKREDCPFCGVPQLAPIPFSLNSYPKEQHPPEKTFEQYEHLISPITGIVSSLHSIPLKESLHGFVFGAGHLMMSSSFLSRSYFDDKRTSSAGKGKTVSQAKTSCLCEAIERFSGVFQPDDFREKHLYSKIKNDAIHPTALLLFSEKQYAMRMTLNQTAHKFSFIPPRFQEEKEIDWTPVWSLTENRYKWVPTAFCYYSYPFQSDEESFCRGDSNGCAAGNTKEQAILQGFFELIERDAIALWWYSRLKMPGVDIESFSDPYLDRVAASYNRANRMFWVLDITADLPIPTFVAVSYCPSSQTERICFGFGTELNPLVAIQRAVSEMLQMECSDYHEEKKDHQINIIINWLNNEKIKNHPYLIPDPNRPMKKREDYPHIIRNEWKDDVIFCQKMVEAKGLEMLILDQTRSSIKLPVVRVIVPGLRHFWSRFAPGRLYDVPVQLGHLKTPMKEEDLNPIHMFI